MNITRANEILSELHQLRYNTSGTSPAAPYNKRMIAKFLPLDKKHVLSMLQERLLPTPPKPNTITLEDGSTLVQPRSSLDNIKICTLDNLHDEVQTSLSDTAEYVTDMILTRMLVEVANIVITSFA